MGGKYVQIICLILDFYPEYVNNSNNSKIKANQNFDPIRINLKMGKESE